MADIDAREIIKRAYEKILAESKNAKWDTTELRKELQQVSQELILLTRSLTQATLAGIKEEALVS